MCDTGHCLKQAQIEFLAVYLFEESKKLQMSRASNGFCSGSRLEEYRVPDLKRCERVRWIPWVIEYGVALSEIDVWQNVRGQQINTLLWYVEEYLVVLGKRSGYWLLKTAYCTENQRRIYKLRIERDLFLKTTSIDGSK